MNKKSIAYLILGLTYLFPFRYAYLTPPDTGFKSLFYFLLVVIGTAIFTILFFNSEKNENV